MYIFVFTSENLLYRNKHPFIRMNLINRNIHFYIQIDVRQSSPQIFVVYSMCQILEERPHEVAPVADTRQWDPVMT